MNCVEVFAFTNLQSICSAFVTNTTAKKLRLIWALLYALTISYRRSAGETCTIEVKTSYKMATPTTLMRWRHKSRVPPCVKFNRLQNVCLVWFLRPSQHFSVMSGRIFLDLFSTKQEMQCQPQLSASGEYRNGNPATNLRIMTLCLHCHAIFRICHFVLPFFG